MLAGDLVQRPPTRPGREEATTSPDLVVVFGEHPAWTRRLNTLPGAFPPPDPCRFPEAWRVDQGDRPAAVGVSDHPAGGATHHRRSGLDRDDQHVTVGLHDIDHVQPLEANEQVTVVAVGDRSGAAEYSVF